MIDRILVAKLKGMSPAEIGTLEVKKFNPLVVVVNLLEYIKELEIEVQSLKDRLSETQPTQPKSEVPGVSDGK
jgi:hypothetical protein